MNNPRYCPRCEAHIFPYLGQEDIYRCGVCGQSYDKKDTLDLPGKEEREKPGMIEKLLGKLNYPNGNGRNHG